MSDQDIIIRSDVQTDVVDVTIEFKTDKFVGHDAKFEVFSEVDVQDSRGVNATATHFHREFTVRGSSQEFQIPKHSISGFDYKGEMVVISVSYRVKIDDGVFYDTTVKGKLLEELIEKPEVSSNAKELIEPKDVFKFLKNLKVIPFKNQVATIVLSVVGLIVMAVNSLVGVHDQFSAESGTYFYSHVDSDGDSQSPFFNSLFLSGAAGAAVWYGMRSQLRRYMKLDLRKISGTIGRESSLPVSDLIHGQSRVDLKDIVLRIVACNLEKGQYIRGSGSNRRTVSFSEACRGVLLFEKKISLIKKRTPVEDSFPDHVNFEPMFDVLYPPNMVSSSHGLDVYWEIQLIHHEFVDHELVPPVTSLKTEDFYQDHK